MSYARASAGKPHSCQNATNDTPSAAIIVVHATAPAVRRENARIPTRPLTRAPRPGRRGINQMYVMSTFITGAGASPFHQVHLVNVHRLFVPVEREDDPESHRRFC